MTSAAQRACSVLMVLVAWSGHAAGQEPPPDFNRPTGNGPGGSTFVGRGQSPEVGLIAVEPFDTARPVVGAPYRAEAITERTQTLPDGSRIRQQTSAALARDGRGRIRREHDATIVGPFVAQRQTPLVTISDPATGTHVTLDAERRMAHRLKTAPADSAARGEFNIAIPWAAGRQPGPPASATRTHSRTEQLGTRTIEGVTVEGSRTTLTIPAGAIGNELPLTIVSERWYSLELQALVRTRRSDPRIGDTVYRLVHIVRGEPSPSLFEVPADYRVEDLETP
ncbi:MAG TPA: hypothetical protein VI485_03805 [Vicinamibacterales bacterium]|nr:hypothetical protein [Vicinamibacterales bacterium]